MSDPLLHETPDALFNRGPVLAVGPKMLEDLKRRAMSSARGRFRLCLHAGPEAAVQEMVIASRLGAYCRPHMHPDSGASVLVLGGEMDLVVFNADGAVENKLRLGPPMGSRPCCAHLAAGRCHMDVVRSPVVLIYETAAGPFVKGRSSVFPAWAPEEADAAGVAALLARVAAAKED